MKVRILLGFAIVSIVVIVIVITHNMNNVSDTNISEVIIREVLFQDNAIQITGNFLSSSKAFKDYSYYTENSNLYLTIKGGLPTKKHPSGDFDFVIRDSVEKIENIYLKYGEQTSLIYSR